jgi:hypothetical protein
LAGRFTILVGALSTRLLFSMVMAPISGATPPLLFFSLSSFSFSPLLSRENLFLHFLSLFFPCALAREKSFSALSFSPLFSRENPFLHFLSLFFPC